MDALQIRGLYRGVASPLVGGALETAVNYSVYNAARRQLSCGGGVRPAPRYSDTLDSLAAGAVAGVALTGVLGPAELVKCRVQAGGDAGVAAAVTRIYRDHGLGGFTRGMGATLAREVPGNAIFFASYEGASRASRRSDAADACLRPLLHLTALQRAWPGGVGGGMSAVMCGGLAGMVYWAVVLPIDTAKTRLQVATPCGIKDMGLIAHMREVYAQRGLRHGLYAGAGPVMLRAFVANAVQWAAWEAAVVRLHQG